LLVVPNPASNKAKEVPMQGWYLVVDVTPEQLEAMRGKLEPVIRAALEELHLTPRVDDTNAAGKPGLNINFVTG